MARLGIILLVFLPGYSRITQNAVLNRLFLPTKREEKTIWSELESIPGSCASIEHKQPLLSTLVFSSFTSNPNGLLPINQNNNFNSGVYLLLLPPRSRSDLRSSRRSPRPPPPPPRDWPLDISTRTRFWKKAVSRLF